MTEYRTERKDENPLVLAGPGPALDQLRTSINQQRSSINQLKQASQHQNLPCGLGPGIVHPGVRLSCRHVLIGANYTTGLKEAIPSSPRCTEQEPEPTADGVAEPATTDEPSPIGATELRIAPEPQLLLPAGFTFVAPDPPRPSISPPPPPPPPRSLKPSAPPWPSGSSASPWLVGSPFPPWAPLPPALPPTVSPLEFASSTMAPISNGSTMGPLHGCGLGPAWLLLLQVPSVFSLTPPSTVSSLDSVRHPPPGCPIVSLPSCQPFAIPSPSHIHSFVLLLTASENAMGTPLVEPRSECMCNLANQTTIRHGRMTSSTRKHKSTFCLSAERSVCLLCVPPCKRYITSGDTHSTLCQPLSWLTARIVSCFLCGCSAPRRLSLRREPSLAFPRVLVPLPPRRSGRYTFGDRRWICWREWRRLTPYLLTYPADPMPVPRVRKPASRLLPSSAPGHSHTELHRRLADPSSVREFSGRSLTVKQFQQLLGLMAAASNVIPFGLLYMRPLQWWLKSKGFSPRGNPLRMIKVTRRGLRALDMWRKPWFLNQGPVLGARCCRVTLATDACLTGWGAVMSGRSARGLWSGRHLSWHINCLEMLAVFRALKYFLPDLRDRHVLVRTDSTAVVYYINHQGGLRSRPLYKLAHQILVWSQDKLLSLRAVHIPGHLNVGADVLSRQGPRPGEWMLHPEVVKQIWEIFGPAQVDLFATRENTQFHPAPLGLDAMVQTWPRLRLYAFPPIALTPGRGQPTLSSPILAGPSMVLGPDISPRRLSMGDSRQEGSPPTGGGHHPPPPPGAIEAVGVASEGAQLIASGLSTEVVETILQSRAPSTRKLYAQKWKLFTSWCGERQQDPANCPGGTVLEFLQARFSTGLAHSTLKVYVAAISAYHAPLGGMPVGKDPLVVRFLRSVLRLRPPTRPLVPTWDLAVVLEALCRPPFESIEEIPVRFLTIKTALLLALTSLKRVGDLQALSVAPSHLEFAPGITKAFLYPRLGYVPKVPTNTPQPVVLQAFCPPPFREPDQQKLNCMCPVRALDAYVHRAALWRKSEQLFVCYGPAKKGYPASKETLSRWIVDAISTAYESSDLPSPMGVKAHSTRAMAASKALMAGVPIQDICNAAGWSTPHTFVSHCRLLCSPALAQPLGRDLEVWGRGHLILIAFSDAARVPEGEHPRRCVSIHPSGIPAERSLHPQKLTPAASHMLLCFLVDDVIRLLHMHSERGSAKGVPIAFSDAASRSLREPWLHT
ncbi:hypothetical protein M9458_026364 [Cirrhinus mrigala]|uniref:Uncharacterized protein n=1 Tax=Cirrhinus mrigala TaxID=683832 RepID=A0ABD0PUK8_CIRMR